MKKLLRVVPLGVGLVLVLLGAAPTVAEESASDRLDTLVSEASEIKTPHQSAQEIAEAAKSYRKLLGRLDALEKGESTELATDVEIDAGLLRAHLETRLFEIEKLELHKVSPGRYISLFSTSGLFLRPCGASGNQIDRAIEELGDLPKILANGKVNLGRPARVWTENALYTVYYAKALLRDEVPELCTDISGARERLIQASQPALAALENFESWLESELLPRSTRSPAWSVEEIDFYQLEHEGLDGYSSREMLAIALDEEQRLLEEMTALAARIHPSGDLATVWEVMKEEAPAWSEVPAMAQRYVEMADAWLRGPGAHLVDIPEEFDYGVQITAPMGRRILSFGGASYGPTTAGRISGYYVLTPLEERLSSEEKASRIRSYNPYWTHVISYHEWLGHNVQRAFSNAYTVRPMRKLFRSSYLSQAWSFYLEKLLEDEGYFETLPHVEALKTRMARLQMRMWRVQRIITKVQMALGEMTFDQAVTAYVEKIGMEPTNAFIEVQRDSQSPSPPGREIIGERVILEMRDAYQQRMGEHYQLRHFHKALLRYGELPLPTVRRLMLGD